jgi:5-hydroxyisourate hydrolase
MITTHVLDLSIGKPAAGVRVVLASIIDGERRTIASAVTDADGRIRDLLPASAKLNAAIYDLTFETGAYFTTRGVPAPPFHPRVIVTFEITDPAQHYHVPLLISPFGYTTYRGS